MVANGTLEAFDRGYIDPGQFLASPLALRPKLSQKAQTGHVAGTRSGNAPHF
jgi:hypothetical protein